MPKACLYLFLRPEDKQVFDKCLKNEWICELIKKYPEIAIPGGEGYIQG